jgi:PilZ domain
MVNKRKYIRVHLDLSVSCSLLDPSGVSDRRLEAILTDLSAGGAKLVATEPIIAGQPMRLTLRSAEPALDITVIGTIVRIDPKSPEGAFPFSVRFATLGDAERVALTRYVLRAARTRGQGADRIVPGAPSPPPDAAPDAPPAAAPAPAPATASVAGPAPAPDAPAAPAEPTPVPEAA